MPDDQNNSFKYYPNITYKIFSRKVFHAHLTKSSTPNLIFQFSTVHLTVKEKAKHKQNTYYFITIQTKSLQWVLFTMAHYVSIDSLRLQVGRSKSSPLCSSPAPIDWCLFTYNYAAVGPTPTNKPTELTSEHDQVTPNQSVLDSRWE